VRFASLALVDTNRALALTTPPSKPLLTEESLRQFASLVESAGVKRFAMALNLSTRQVNRILTGAQPNPIERLILALQAAEPEAGDRVLDYICQEMGGNFVRHQTLETSTVNAIKECAEAIAAISDGEVSAMGVQDIREAISALSNLISTLHQKRPDMR
jgi:hypothetical protein